MSALRHRWRTSSNGIRWCERCGVICSSVEVRGVIEPPPCFEFVVRVEQAEAARLEDAQAAEGKAI